jgi:hypothetical protein
MDRSFAPARKRDCIAHSSASNSLARSRKYVDELGSKFGRAAVVAESGKVGPDDEIWHRALFRGLASARATANR